MIFATQSDLRILSNILFIDIETVGVVAEYSLLDEEMQKLWERKYDQISKPDDLSPQEAFIKRAAIYSEFGKIIVIAIGYLKEIGIDKYELRIRSLQNESEEKLLQEFSTLLNKFDQQNTILCGHNIKEFDLPYICRRMIVNRIALPEVLNLSGKKPWEVKHIDTMELWSFGDRKNFTSLNLLSQILGIESSKQDIDGSQVHNVFYEEKNLERVATYCKKDVAVTAQLFFRLRGLSLKEEVEIVFL